MPTKAEKLLERMRKSKNNWKLKDLISLYEGFGFIITSGRKHDKVSHPDYPELLTTIHRHSSKVSIYMVNQAIKLVDKLKALEESEEEEANE